jgi:hypothetical protein
MDSGIGKKRVQQDTQLPTEITPIISSLSSSTTSQDSDKIIFNYKLLSQVSVGDKLRVTEGELSIDNRYTIFRIFSGDNRYDIVKFIFDMVSETKNMNTSKVFLKQDMQQSLIGIKNLGKTYIEDETIQARIELIIRNINNIILTL